MLQQQIHGRLRSCVSRSLTDEEGSQRMLFWKAVLERFHNSRRGNRARDKRNSNRFEGFGRETLGGKPGPETVTVARHRREASYAMVANEVVDFAALDVC